ncbi:MAG: M4 family metallopeptidase [Cytophagales bacterium]|nr:M4 family metallopeptidase [Cytophagales bacterium]
MKRFLLLILTCSTLGAFSQSQELFDTKKKSERNKEEITLRKFKPTTSSVTTSAPEHTSITALRKFNHEDLSLQVKTREQARPPRTLKSLYEKSGSDVLKVTDAKKYLNQHKGQLLIQDPSEEFHFKSITTDQQGFQHFRFDQYFQGYKVYASQIIVHENAKGLHMLNGIFHKTPANLKEPQLDLATAKKMAAIDLTGSSILPEFKHDLSMLAHVSMPGDLVIYHVNESPYLAYHLEVRSALHEHWEYFIDAHDGTVLNKFNKICFFDATTSEGTDLSGTNQNMNVVSEDGLLYMADISREMYDQARTDAAGTLVGAILTLDAASDNDIVSTGNGVWSDASAVSAHVNAGIAYEYFRQTHGRNSINGSGGNILSLVNVPDPDTGDPMDNAFWDGQAIYYGNGDSFFSPLAGSLDVAGHEMSHGVVSNTADLVYQDQPGALNESFADIFGAMMDRDDWLIGEDIVLNGTALRSLENPAIGDQPAHMRDLFTGPEDNGGVHINSGIPNHAYYLFATEVGLEVAELIFYRALDVYLTASSDFADFRTATLQAATDLHGQSSVEVAALANALDAVGIFGQAPTPEEEDLEVITGDNFILSLDTNENDTNTLYLSSTQGTDFVALTSTTVSNKPSVTDNGELAVYVGGDSQLFTFDLTGTNGEEMIDDQTVWGNVAISKDGNRIALNTNFLDPSIYVLDLVSGEFKQFELYNPTFTEGVQAAGVQFADAMEWDYSGEFLVYDGFNTIKQEVGDDIDFWDVGFIRVWDNDVNGFGDGEIFKLFTNLPEGVSIVNPSFSKTSSDVLAFDYYDATTQEIFLLATDIESGEVSFLTENNVLGYPNFATDDSQLIFNTFSSETDFISSLALESDRITASGSPSPLIQFGRWGIWFAQGERALQSDEKELVEFGFRSLDPVVLATISGTTVQLEVPFDTDVTSLISNFVLSAEASAYVSGTEQVSGVTVNDFTSQVDYVVKAEDGSEETYSVIVAKEEEPLNSAAEKVELKMFPVPIKDHLQVRSINAIERISIFSLNGQKMYAEKFTKPQSTFSLDLSSFKAGPYVLELVTIDGLRMVKRVRKE